MDPELVLELELDPRWVVDDVGGGDASRDNKVGENWFDQF